MAATESTVAIGAPTICSAFQATARALAPHSALRSSDGAIDWNWGEYARRVNEAAGGLAGLGVKRGDTVVCWMLNRPEFHVADIAAMHLGAAPLALDPALTADQAAPLIKDSGARVMIVGQRTVERALAIRETGRTALRPIVAVDDAAAASVMSWPELLECIPEEFELDSTLAAVQPTDVALLAYDAADIAAPALAEITHAELMAKLRDLSQRCIDKDTAAFAGLPMSHLPARLCTHYLAIVHGWQVTAR